MRLEGERLVRMQLTLDLSVPMCFKSRPLSGRLYRAACVTLIRSLSR